jgi:hypothetical protein
MGARIGPSIDADGEEFNGRNCGLEIVHDKCIGEDSPSYYDSAKRNLVALFILFICPYRRCYQARMPLKSATFWKMKLKPRSQTIRM